MTQSSNLFRYNKQALMQPKSFSMLRMLGDLALLGCLFFLTHCTLVTPESHLNQPKLAIPYTMPVSAYLAMAKNQTGTEKQSLILMAAGRAIYEGQWQYGLNLIQGAGPLTGDLADEKNLLLAKIHLMRNQPNQAITQLAAIHNLHKLSSFQRAQYHDMLAYAYQTTGALVEAVLERIKLDPLLLDPSTKSNNRRALWLCLTKLSQAEIDTLVAEPHINPILQGWVSLADISRKTYHNPERMIVDLDQWQEHYPNHPANAFLPSQLDKVNDHLYARPKHMALLLPLTGALSGPGKAVEDGFMAAYQASGQSDLSVRVYNTDDADVARVYEQALANGADYVVGPLTKSDVAKIARMPHPVPTILLNETPKISDHNAFQFGLSPTQEARQVAMKAHKAGFSKALVIAPAGPWGVDVVHAFSSQWAANGGQIVETWHFTPEADLGLGVRQLLRASESAARIRPTKRVSGSDNHYKRRQDFDVLILIAYPSKARAIMPLIRYYFASDVPIYSTSAVYSGIENTVKDRDLNGIIFCDMPWVFSHQMGRDHYWSEQLNGYNRLYALGMDSFTLSSQLNQLLLFPAIGINEQSGVIYLTKGNKLSRILVFGQFRQGVAHILDGAQDKSII